MIKASGLASLLGALAGIGGVFFLGLKTPQGAALLIVMLTLIFAVIGALIGVFRTRKS